MQWAGACIFISTDENTDQSPWYTKILRTNFKENSGTIISLNEKVSHLTYLELSENTFTQNTKSIAIESKRGNVIDN